MKLFSEAMDWAFMTSKSAKSRHPIQAILEEIPGLLQQPLAKLAGVWLFERVISPIFVVNLIVNFIERLSKGVCLHHQRFLEMAQSWAVKAAAIWIYAWSKSF